MKCTAVIKLLAVLEFYVGFDIDVCVQQASIQDLLLQDQDQDSEVPRPRSWSWPRLWGSRPRPRPRLWGSRQRPRLKTYKTNTGSPWLGWTVTNKKTEKVMASRKSSIPVVAHSKQQDIIPYLTTVLFPQLPLITEVYQTFAHTRNISKVRYLINN